MQQGKTDKESILEKEGKLEDKSVVTTKITEAIETIKKDSYFLLKNEVMSEDKLLMIVKGSNKDTSAILYKECQKFVASKVREDIDIISNHDQNDKQEDAIKVIQSKLQPGKKDNYQEYLPYLKDQKEGAVIKHYINRVKADEIYKSYEQNQPEQAAKFKLEVQNINRFGQDDKLKDTLKIYQEQGLKQATEFAKTKNTDYVLERLESQDNILKLKEPITRSEYVTAIAKDKNIMSYVDNAIIEGRSFKNPMRDNNLADYLKEREQIKTNELVQNDKAKTFNDFER